MQQGQHLAKAHAFEVHTSGVHTPLKDTTRTEGRGEAAKGWAAAAVRVRLAGWVTRVLVFIFVLVRAGGKLAGVGCGLAQSGVEGGGGGLY
jgi:hypothetical protein